MPNLFSYIAAALLGLSLGSFANVLVLRDDRRKTIVTGRSECPHCKKPLRWYELIPVFSFVFLRGRCSGCHKPISWQYPLVEALTSALFVFAVWRFSGGEPNLIAAGLLALSLLLFLVVSVIDIRTMYVPVEYCVIAGLLGAAAFWDYGISPTSMALGLVAGAGSIIAVILLWRLFFHQEGMGSGDIWVAGAVGVIVGWPQVLMALAVAVFSGAIVGVAMLPGSRKGSKLAIPFGPFLFLGLLATLVLGDRFISWYQLVTI